MANTQNDNLIEMSSNELVRYINKFKVISKYDDKKYESNEVELINPALENLEVKILDPVKDENEITLTAVVENGDSNQTYNYQWLIYKEDGETELPYGLGTDTATAHIEDLDELEQFCLVSVAAYTTQGLFVGISDIKTIYKDTEDITSPVIIDLSNDSATIPAELISSDTTDDTKLFQELTVTYLTVLRGDEDITDDCDINWEASSSDVAFTVSENKRTVYITAMSATLKAASLIATVEYPKALTENQTGILTAKYNIIRAGEGATLYQLQLPQKVINTTYFTNNETYTYSYSVKKCSGRQVTQLTQDQLDEEGLEVVWGYKEAQDVDLEDYTWEPTIDGTFEYEIGTHTGLHIVLRSKNDNDLARYYDSEIISFVKDGAEFTDLILSANSPSFNVDANGNFAQDTVVLTASLYGLLEKQENLIEWTWSLGDVPSGKVSSDRKTFTIAKTDMGTNNAIEVGAAIKINGEDYYDKMTIYKLKEGSSALTAFLTNQCINFSANADGVVNADNNNTHTSKVRVFRGSEDISDLVSEVEIPSTKPQGMNIVIESITENDKQFKQIKIGIIEGQAVNLGGVGSCDGELEFNITLTGSETKIPLTLSWSKNNAGKDGAAGLNGTSPYTIQLDNDSDIIVKSSNGDWFVDDDKMAIVVNVACYKGDQKDDTVTANDCKCDPPSTDWENGCYTWDGEELRITKVPDSYNFTSGYFTFRWIKSGVTLATKNFSLSSTIALADYDLIIPQVVYNIDKVKTGETFAISVLKKSKDKIETLTSRGSEKIKILGPTGDEVTDWGVVPVPQVAGNYTYTLKSTTADNLTWDEEVLTTVSDGVDGLGYTGVQLVAPSQVFVRNPNTGAITPDSVKLTAKLSGDLKGQTSKLKWYKDGSLISNDGKSELQVASSNLSEDKKQVTYKVKVDDGNTNDNDDYDDEFSFYLVTEGADGDDAYSAWLSDQSWSFTGDKDGYVTKNVTKSTTVKIYKGGEEVTSSINITSTTANSSALASGGTFTPNGATLTFTTKNSDKNNLGGAKNVDGTIDIKAKLGDKEFDLVLSWDKVSTGDPGDNGTSPYLIELTNDSATIGTDKDGKGANAAALQAATTTTVQVWLGSNDITNNCTFNWTYSNCALSSTSGKTVYLTAISDTQDTATATVTVMHGQVSVGSKTLTVTKNKQGETGNDAVTYVLSVSPNSWNKTNTASITPSFIVTKYSGSTISNIPTDKYTIKVGENSYGNTPITNTTTFDLYIGDIKVDSETVSAVENGNDSTVEGPAGPGLDSEVKVYQWGQTAPSIEKELEHWKDIHNIVMYNDDLDGLFLWYCYKQEWTGTKGVIYTPPIRMTDYEMGTLMASKEDMSISEWCEKYGRTLIDGSTVATGGLIAETIQSGDYASRTGAEFALNFTPAGDHYKVGLKTTGIPFEVLIPEKYNGKSVTELDVESFAAGKDIIQKLAIPAGITTNPFGLLTDYSKLVELHLPVHQIGYNSDSPYFGNWFGMEDYDGPGGPPDLLTSIYLLGRNGNNTIPEDYFDLESSPIDANVYLTSTITALNPNALRYNTAGTIYYYNDDQFTNTDIANAGGTLTKTNEAYTYPGASDIAGFCITSKEDRPMIDSPNFQVEQDGTIYAKAGMIGGVAIGEVEALPSQISDVEAKTIEIAKGLSGGQQTTIASNYIISPYIGGGYLNIKNQNSAVVIDPSKEDIFAVNSNGIDVIKINKVGSATFVGTIDARDGYIGSWQVKSGALVSNTPAAKLQVGSLDITYDSDTKSTINTEQALVLQGGKNKTSQIVLYGDNWESDGVTVTIEIFKTRSNTIDLGIVARPKTNVLKHQPKEYTLTLQKWNLIPDPNHNDPSTPQPLIPSSPTPVTFKYHFGKGYSEAYYFSLDSYVDGDTCFGMEYDKEPYIRISNMTAGESFLLQEFGFGVSSNSKIDLVGDVYINGTSIDEYIRTKIAEYLS